MHKHRIYLSASIMSLVTLGFYAHALPYFSWDLALTNSLQSLPFLKNIMLWVSWPGYFPQGLVVALLALAFLIARKFYWEAVCGFIGLAFSQGIMSLLKIGIGRERPSASLVHVSQIMSDKSFPSGHVVMYVVAFGFFIYLLNRRHKNLMFLMGIMIVLIGPSRVYLGEHWPSDVIGAYLLGTFLLWSLIKFYNWHWGHK